MMLWEVYYDSDGERGDLAVCHFNEERHAETHAKQIGASMRQISGLSELPTSITIYHAIFYSWLRPLSGENTDWSYAEEFAKTQEEAAKGEWVDIWQNLSYEESKRPWTVAAYAMSQGRAIEILEAQVSSLLGQSWKFKERDGLDLLKPQHPWPIALRDKPENFEVEPLIIS